MGDSKLIKAATTAVLTIDAIHQWLDRVDDAGGATSITGIAACNAMLKSLRNNRSRVEQLVLVPLRNAIAEREKGS